jgi:hypothetical protein
MNTLYFIPKPVVDYYGFKYVTSNRNVRTYTSDYIIRGNKILKSRTGEFKDMTPEALKKLIDNFDGIIYSCLEFAMLPCVSSRHASL